jgi:hypothetical protein
MERGSVLLEFGLVIVLLATFLFGIIDFGRALYTYHFVANAAREATRYASVHGSASCAPSGPPCTLPDVETYVKGITPAGISQDTVVATPTWLQYGPGSSAATANGGCDPSNAGTNPGCIVQVQVTYPFKFIFPLLPTGTVNMTSTSQMVISQ